MRALGLATVAHNGQYGAVGSRRKWGWCRVVVVLVALCVAACSDDDETGSTGETSDPTTTSTSVASSTSTTSTSTTSTLAPAPDFPDARRTLEHGGQTWAVVLAGSPDFDDPALGGAQDTAADAGYTTGPGDCDAGAAEALGFSGGTGIYTVSVYFDSRQSAEQALAAFRAREVDGVVAQVETYCLD